MRHQFALLRAAVPQFPNACLAAEPLTAQRHCCWQGLAQEQALPPVLARWEGTPGVLQLCGLPRLGVSATRKRRFYHRRECIIT